MLMRRVNVLALDCFGIFPVVPVVIQLHKRGEKSSWKEQKFLQEQSEIKILSGFC